MKELILVIAKALVDHPEDVRVHVKDERSTIYELSVHPSDVGKIIGKQGRIAKAIRTVVNSAATKSNERVIVNIQS
ncbi:MAG TPA: KH domain-containing protein [Candidatus Paenibacillus intestinavium]|uniref:RNA-binding protein KhpA n=1 Tax=Candidatus Pristimantibacillus lignocellulolyticus TaxID=2994561 RepID=A0A9J6ZB35_9BACL|nr:KH domain-containing protein [Paenibacillus endoradicis]MCR8656216.1 KH domain-containing protein [Paenibacillus endoradicis]URN93365.1 MAG: KH domain-containing protein [Candidatus Pristimantibacillus lignocellulolyticus]HIW34738.1 KH domain-containing protein [Candidatus Paenibacillus intestinavium]